MMRYMSILVAVTFLSTIQCQRFTDVVKTHKGYIQGRIFETIWHSQPYSAFQGIPYAKPPLGDLRFKNPVEHDPWDGVKKTIDDHPGCAALLLYYPMGEEDCLYLNVYTPVIDFKNITKLRPVMFWIFGGGFQAGFSDRWAYGPDFFLEDDVVFVSLNYRLGAFGFLALGLPDAQGNQGLKDMQLALEWVQKNIAYFGGDPNQVTLFGESAGATAVGYHMLSPKSEGLFHKAIFQSGTFLAPWAYQSPAEARRLAFELGARMQIQASNEEELLHALKNADVRDIITATSTMITFFFPFGIVMPFIGTIETHQMNTTFLNESPIKKLQTGNYKRVPVLMGYNKDEGVVYASVMSIVWKVLTNQIYMITDPGLRNLGDLFINKINPIVNATIWEKIKALSLQDFNWPIDITQRYFAHHNGDIPVYYYHMSHDTKYNLHRLVEPDMNGTSHGDDLSLMFHFAVISPTNPDLLYNRFRKKVVNMWTNFAKYGDPTPDEKTIGIRWLPSGKKGLQLDIGYNTFRMGNRVITKQAELFEKMYHKQLLSTHG